jgi:lipoprotein-releasing system permease protein
MQLPFELFVAWRYLRERGRRSGVVTIEAGVLCLLAALALMVIVGQYAHLHPYELSIEQGERLFAMKIAALASFVVGVLVIVFGVFHALQSIFTTVSTYGVFLGTAALVIVLSVMNGFETDLRQKILGSNAHMLIARAEGDFTDWREVQQKLDGVCAGGSCVVAHTPYVSSEVAVSANANYRAVIIKGIDPRSVGRVTNLERYMTTGDVTRVWPLDAKGNVVEPATPITPAAPPPTGDDAPPVGEDAPPEDFSGGAAAADAGADDSPPEDFSGGADAAAPEPPLPPRRPRPLRPDPRVLALDGMLVGRELARDLRLYEGEEVEVISAQSTVTPAGEVPRTKAFRVGGVFFTGMFEYDAKLVYVSIGALQRFLGLGDAVTGVEIKVSDIEVTDVLAAELRKKLGPDYVVKDWQELNRGLFTALKLEQIVMFLILTIIILVASFSIVSNLIMVVVEKAREIAILKSMGSSDGSVMRIFIAEGLYIGTLGTVFGLVVGLGSCWAIGRFGLPISSEVYYIEKLPVAVQPWSIVAIAFAGVLISVLATVYPAWVGARLRPVDGLRH